jgi:hypothetical protein
LLHSLDATVGFLLGKTQQHTFRDEMEERVKVHLQRSQAKERGQASSSDDLDLPPAIPIAVKPRGIKHQQTTAEVITVFCAAKDKSTVKALLEKYPFPLVDIVMFEGKKGNKDQWDQHLQVHNILVNSSAAIKIMNANDKFKHLLMEAAIKDSSAKSLIIDIARRRTTAKNDILYVQTRDSTKKEAGDWVKRTMDKICASNKFAKQPFIPAEGEEEQSDTEASKSTKQTRFHHLLGQQQNDKIRQVSNQMASFRTTGSRSKSQRVPNTIIIGQRPPAAGQEIPRSYAAVAIAQDRLSSSHDASVGSQEGSTTSTVKTLREIQLEEELESANTLLREMKGELNTALEQNKLLEKRMEEQHNLMEQAMEQKLEEQRQAFTLCMEEQKEQMMITVKEMLREARERERQTTENLENHSTPRKPKKQNTNPTPVKPLGVHHAPSEDQQVAQIQYQQQTQPHYYGELYQGMPPYQAAPMYSTNMHPGRPFSYPYYDQQQAMMSPLRNQALYPGSFQEGGPATT